MHVHLLAVGALILQVLGIPAVNITTWPSDDPPKNPDFGRLICFRRVDGTPDKQPDLMPTGVKGQRCMDENLEKMKAKDTRRPPQLASWSKSERGADFQVPEFFWAKMSNGNGCAARILMRDNYNGVAYQGIWDFIQGVEYINRHCALDRRGGYGLGGSISVGRYMGVSWIGTPPGWPPERSRFLHGAANPTGDLTEEQVATT